MKIYATPFRASDKKPTGPSVDSGFEDLDSVVLALGEPDIKWSKRMLIYGPGEDRIAFSEIIFCIDGDGITG